MNHLDRSRLRVELRHKLVQGAKVLLDLSCEVPAGRLVLLRSMHACLSLASGRSDSRRKPCVAQRNHSDPCAL